MKKSNRFGRNAALIILILCVLGITGYLIVGKLLHKSISNKVTVLQSDPSAQDFNDASYEGNGKWYGLCKKNSIHSINDFRKTVMSDPMLKSHYADFKWEYAKTGRLEKATWAYVYYRKNETIFRKQKPIVLPAGDEYITDGNVSVRTTCCNRYTLPPSDPELDANPAAGPTPPNEEPGVAYQTPQEPHHSPDPAIRDIRGLVPPPVPPYFVGKITLTDDPHDPRPRPKPDPCPPCLGPGPCPPCHDSCPGPGPCDPPKPVPEPSSIFLLGIGVVFCHGLLFFRRKAKKQD